jgi:hypothetical protein
MGKMDMNNIGKWIHICCHLGYDHRFQSLTSEFIRRSTRKDILEKVSVYFLSLFPSLQGLSLSMGGRAVLTQPRSN